jgi:iron complex outermembrane receptor protein
MTRISISKSPCVFGSIFSLGLSLSVATPAHSNELPDIQIQVQRDTVVGTTQPGLEKAQETVRQTPGGAGVVDSESFTDGRVSTLADALGYATGVFIQPRFGAEEARLSIRGSGLQRTFHGRGIRLTQDGIPVNLADGSFDFQAIEALSTQHIEVFRGANAFGLGAANLGGSINYVSETGLTAPKASARVEMGPFGYVRSAVQGATHQGTWDAYAMLTQFRQDGFRDFSKQEGVKLISNIGMRVNSDVETRFFLASVRSNSELPGNLTLAQIQQNASQANAGNVAGKNRRDLDIDRVSNRTVIRTANGLIDLNVFVSMKELFHPIFQVIEQQNKDWGGQIKYSMPHMLAGKASETTVGMGLSKGITDNTNRANQAGQPKGGLLDQSQQVAQNQDVFVENKTYIRPDLILVTALQHQQAERKYNGFNSGANPQQFFFDKDYQQTSPRVGLIKTLADNSQVYGNVSGSFEPPSFGELGVAGAAAQFTINNQAQDAVSAEVGYRGARQNWSWDVSAYVAQIDKELMATVVPGTQISSTFNVNETRRLGMELGWAYANGPWTVRNSTLLNHFRFNNDSDFGDNRIAGIPSVATRLAMDHQINPSIKVGASVEAAGRTGVDHKNTTQAPGYGIVNARVSGKLQRNVEWFVDGRNLGDKAYVATTGVVRAFSPAAGAQFLPGDGRGFYTGISVAFK